MVRLSRYKASVIPQPLTIRRVHHLALTSIARYHYLTAEQVTRLHYSEKSLTHVLEALSALFHAHYTRKVYLPKPTPEGSSKAFHCLRTKARTYLRHQGVELYPRFKEDEEAERYPLFLRHTQLANDLLILCELLAKQDSAVTIKRMKTERELRHEPIKLANNQSLIPDGWIELDTGRPVPIAFELDRGTMTRRDWSKKVLGYAQAIRGPYQETFGTERLTVAVVTTNQDRATQLLTWTQLALNEFGDRTLAELMVFSAGNPANADPVPVFRTPLWRMPYSANLHPLLE